jgi:hypothetical protein
VLIFVVGLYIGARSERVAIINGLVTDEELATMAAGLKQGLDFWSRDFERHEALGWHSAAGEEIARAAAERSELQRNDIDLAKLIDKYHVHMRGVKAAP